MTKNKAARLVISITFISIQSFYEAVKKELVYTVVFFFPSALLKKKQTIEVFSSTVVYSRSFCILTAHTF